MRVKAARSGTRREAELSGPNWRLSDNIIISISRARAYIPGPAANCLSPKALPQRHSFCSKPAMIQMHSSPKEQREAVRQLVHSVLIRAMATFNAERFKKSIKGTDARLRKAALSL